MVPELRRTRPDSRALSYQCRTHLGLIAYFAFVAEILSVSANLSGHTCMRRTRYGWNFSVFLCGIIPSNPLAYFRRIRKKRNHANEPSSAKPMSDKIGAADSG